MTLRIRASVLFHHAHQLASCWEQRRRLDHTDYFSGSDDYAGLALPSGFTDEFQAIEQAITRFLSSQIPIHQLETALPEDRQACITAYTLANAAMIHLSSLFGDRDPTAYEKSLRAAKCCVSIVKYITEADYEFLDPVLGVCIHALFQACLIALLIAVLGVCCGYPHSEFVCYRDFMAFGRRRRGPSGNRCHALCHEQPWQAFPVCRLFTIQSAEEVVRDLRSTGDHPTGRRPPGSFAPGFPFMNSPLDDRTLTLNAASTLVPNYNTFVTDIRLTQIELLIPDTCIRTLLLMFTDGQGL